MQLKLLSMPVTNYNNYTTKETLIETNESILIQSFRLHIPDLSLFLQLQLSFWYNKSVTNNQYAISRIPPRANIATNKMIAHLKASTR